MTTSMRAAKSGVRRAGRGTLGRLALLLLLVAPAGFAEGEAATAPPVTSRAPRRVLILTSFGTNFPLFGQVAAELRAGLVEHWTEPFDISEVTLELAPSYDLEHQERFVDYLVALFADRPPDLVVTLGGPAAQFARLHRVDLFPGIALLFAAVDVRILDVGQLEARDAVVPTELDPAESVATILQVLPRTERLAIVIGTSPLERFWRQELARAFATHAERLQLEWLDGLSLAEIRGRVARLPPRSAVFFAMLLVDGAGVPHSQERALAAVRQASRAPVFGLFSTQLGQGVVGGRMLSVSLVGERTAEAASRLLRGEAPAAVRYPPLRPELLAFDARELERWGIAERGLPPGSEIRYHVESRWVTYRWPLLGGLALLGLQTALIVGLVVQRGRRRAAEGEVRALNSRLLTTYEQERGRLARELHDDVTQRLARLAIDAAEVERETWNRAVHRISAEMRQELVRLTDDVHDLSRRLHPTVLYDLGLAEALRAEAERVSLDTDLVVETRLEGAPAELPPEVALGLYRVAQESLRNAARHAGATRVEISLASVRFGVELAVRDDGKGFNPEAARATGGLGLISLRERVNLLGGRLAVISAPGRGTTIVAWAPVAKEAA